jgi:hypothetical protein
MLRSTFELAFFPYLRLEDFLRVAMGSPQAMRVPG